MQQIETPDRLPRSDLPAETKDSNSPWLIVVDFLKLISDYISRKMRLLPESFRRPGPRRFIMRVILYCVLIFLPAFGVFQALNFMLSGNLSVGTETVQDGKKSLEQIADWEKKRDLPLVPVPLPRDIRELKDGEENLVPIEENDGKKIAATESPIVDQLKPNQPKKSKKGEKSAGGKRIVKPPVGTPVPTDGPPEKQVDTSKPKLPKFLRSIIRLLTLDFGSR